MTNPVWFGGDGCMQQRGAKFEGRERFGLPLRRLNSDFENIEHEINQNMKSELYAPTCLISTLIF